MSDLRIGLIGYGHWARSAYLPALRLDGRSEVVAVAAPSDVTRARAAAELGPKLRTFDAAEGLLEAAGIDAIALAVPDAAHERTLATALESGLPVLFEPPVASDRAGVERLLVALRSSPQVVHPDLELSYLPVISRLRAHVDSGAIGQPRSARIRLQAGWGHPPRHALSVVHMLAGWYLDVLDRVVGRVARRVLVLNDRKSTALMQPRAVAHLDYGDVLGTFDVNIAAAGSLSIGVEVNGTEGDITCDPLAGTWRVRTQEHPHWRLDKELAIQPPAAWPGVHECFRAFLDAAEQAQADPGTRDAIIRQHDVGLAADRSCETGEWEDVQHTTGDPSDAN